MLVLLILALFAVAIETVILNYYRRRMKEYCRLWVDEGRQAALFEIKVANVLGWDEIRRIWREIEEEDEPTEEVIEFTRERAELEFGEE